MSLVPQHLTDSSHGVRNKCLQLIGCLGPVEKGAAKEAESQAAKDVQKIIGDHFNDQDPRVRTAAIKAMVSIAGTMEKMVWGCIRELREGYKLIQRGLV